MKNRKINSTSKGKIPVLPMNRGEDRSRFIREFKVEHAEDCYSERGPVSSREVGLEYL